MIPPTADYVRGFNQGRREAMESEVDRLAEIERLRELLPGCSSAVCRVLPKSPGVGSCSCGSVGHAMSDLRDRLAEAERQRDQARLHAPVCVVCDKTFEINGDDGVELSYDGVTCRWVCSTECWDRQTEDDDDYPKPRKDLAARALEACVERYDIHMVPIGHDLEPVHDKRLRKVQSRFLAIGREASKEKP